MNQKNRSMNFRRRFLALLMGVSMLFQSGISLAQEAEAQTVPAADVVIEEPTSASHEGLETETTVVDESNMVSMLEEGLIPVKEPEFFSGTLVHEGPDYTVTAEIGEDAQLPEDIQMRVEEILPGTDDYTKYLDATGIVLAENEELGEFSRFFDISFVQTVEEDGGEKEIPFEPAAEISVQVIFHDPIVSDEETAVRTAQFDEFTPEIVAAEMASAKAPLNNVDAIYTVSFFSSKSSVYGFFQVKKVQKVLTLGGDSYSYHVNVSYDDESCSFPLNATLEAREISETDPLYDAYRKQAAQALEADDVRLAGLFDIGIYQEDGEKLSLSGPVNVIITLNNGLEDGIQIVHFKSASEPVLQPVVQPVIQPTIRSLSNRNTLRTQALPEVKIEEKAEENTEETVSVGEAEVLAASVIEEGTAQFTTDSFSVFALAYTVDFKYDVNGKEYEYSLPGGGFITLPMLLEVLGFNEEINEADLDQFVADIENVEFSSPELVWTGKVEEDTTVGQVKTAHMLECEYSAELTEEQIEEINSAAVSAGEWLLISLKAFTSEETLTVTMKDGEVFTILVTDAQIKKTVMTQSGEAYEITVTFDPAETGIPETADLEVTELLDGEDYTAYVARTEDALGMEEGSAGYIRLFDIRIVDENGEKIQPAEGTAVDVRIALADTESDSFSVVHFADGNAAGDVVENTTDGAENGTTVHFAAEGFSVYAIVEAPQPEELNIQEVLSLDELQDGTAFYLSYNGTAQYFTSNLNSEDAFIEVTDSKAAAQWYFEPTGTGNQFYVYTLVEGEKQYIRNTSGNLVGLSATNKTVFELSEAEAGKFFFKAAGANKWLQHSNGGGGIRFWTDNENNTNSRITITYVSSYSLSRDPYDLDGKTFGIAYNDNSANAAALTATEMTSGTAQRLSGVDMLIRPDVLDNEGCLLVAQNAEITEWTFESVQEHQYYVKTTVDGAVKYLTINGASVTLEDSPSEGSLITATPGTGANSGKWHFSAGTYALNLFSMASSGFGGATGSGATTWMNLVKKSVLSDDDFHLYSARKVSVSDEEEVSTGKQVVIYTRIWNDATKRYEFYAVDHDGSLVRCYDTGDNIEWIGSQVNTAVWAFTEYLNSDGTSSYYYDLKNTQYGNFIAPQVQDGKIFSDAAFGVNLNGRRYGESLSTIIGWDDKYYSYVGLKVEDGHVVACPLAEAEDFYFAVIEPSDPDDELSTVDTIDNNAYGITMRMIDFNNPVVGGRDSVQNPFFGGDNNKAGLLSTNLGGDGYPTTTSVTGSADRSIGTLFSNMAPVNHLLIQSIYNESGYFEYNSTQNFAHLNEDGTFSVYDQIAAIGTSSRPTRTHGQFMPYNEIVPGKYAVVTNQTDELQHEYPDVNPRKGEKLYLIPENEADYYFGMEMEASFTQTASGLDAWGHDIIFEFSGDDDFWFYVDGELVLDLGGVHSAMAGSINFRTGVVTSSRGNSTLYDIFKANYKARGMSNEEISAKLEEIFTRNENGQYVFKDYTNHTMKMFYMERGAGASNLHMRFNLAAVRPSTFVLSKTLSGTDNAENSLLEFPYQIYYLSKADSAWHRLGENEGEADKVLYSRTSSKVRYQETFTPAGGTAAYQNVFFLKPGQSAEVELPTDVLEYYVVECGVNTDVYDRVTANKEVLSGEPSGNAGRYDYKTSKGTLENRSNVEFDNHVNPAAVRTLSITKRLYDVDGEQMLHYPDNSTLFSFRLYLGDENAASDNLPLANLYVYYIKDAEGYYCRWNADTQKFESLGVKTHEALLALFETNHYTSAEKEAVVFKTSMNGSISKIPADYTVEVRDLIATTKFKVEERAGEIPRGYTLRIRDGYTRLDAGHAGTTGDTPITGVIEKNNDPEIEVCNQKGWGLTAEKVWTDKDFMQAHDDIYFAIYVEGKLMDGSVRRLASGETEIYYFFDDLTYRGTTYTFSDFEVREVVLAGGSISVDADGVVTGYDTLTSIKNDGSLTIGGAPVGGEHQEGYMYTVTYTVGTPTGHNENVRIDTVTNSRPGIALYKKDMSGMRLAGAVFTLKDSQGQDVAAASYTSGSDGLITRAYLSQGEYTLSEISAPKGYAAAPDLTITIGENNAVTVTGDPNLFEMVSNPDQDMTAVITVKNRPASFQVKKVDAGTGGALQGAHFALYRQVTYTDGSILKDYLPMPGYEDLTTDGNGILSGISMDLSANVYYLTETQTPEGYAPLTEDLCFSIGEDGSVSVLSEGHASWLQSSTDEDGVTSYVLSIPNGKLKNLELKKVSAGTDTLLPGASFALYRAEDYDDTARRPRDGTSALTQGTTGENGLLALGRVPLGEYRLVETAAPAGYIQLDAPITITVQDSGVTAMKGTAKYDVKEIAEDTWQIEVWNSFGYELPSTGGPGTKLIYLFGSMLIMLASAGFILLGRKKRIE